VTYTSLSRKINETDALIAKFEDGAIARVEAAMNVAFRALDRELRRKWIEGESKDLAGKDRAILMLAEIKDYLSLLPGDVGEVEDLYKALITDAAAAGTDFGAAAIDSIAGDSPGFIAAKTVKPNVKAVAYQAQDAAKRLYRHDADFQLRASKVIEQGLVQGSGVARVASALRRELGVVAAKAETIARTETMSAMDSAARDTYRQNGIEYVQRIGTQDKLICPFCAARAGNVYEIDKAPSSLHPRDRCYNAPWRKQWAEMGLVDEDWLQKHKADIMARLAEQGKKPDYGLAPFERLGGALSPPKAIWSIKQ
jgi:SPP1 gp7 family putative phage head morphogenesis protein